MAYRPMEPRKVACVLGLLRHGSGSYSLLNLNDDIVRGLPVSVVERLRETMAPDMRHFGSLIASRSTIQRYRNTRKRLSSAHSQRAVRLAEAWIATMAVYNDERTARMFLNRPHQLLHGRTALEVAAESEPGARCVTQILGRLKYSSVA